MNPEHFGNLQAWLTLYSRLCYILATLLRDARILQRSKCIHVVGLSPRSGTTLAFELLTSCFDIAKFGDHEISLFERPSQPLGNYASKQPMDLVHVRRVINWDRNLHCIFMDGDPRDIVVSQHGSRPGEYWCDFPVWERNQQLIASLRDHPRVHICRYEDRATLGNG